MIYGLLLLLGVAVVASRPWRTDDNEWFHVSALLTALLLGGLLITLA